MNKLLGISLSLLLFFGVTACSEEEGYVENQTAETIETNPYDMSVGMDTNDVVDLASFDTNQNNMIEEEEFTSRWGESGFYDRWNTDANESLSEDEFAQGIYGTWDTNRDNLIDENEFNDWSGRWFDDQQDYTQWNTDQEEGLTQEEFVTRFRENGVLGNWDLDSSTDINEQEFTEGYYGLLDENQSGAIEENEWSQWGNSFTMNRSTTGQMENEVVGPEGQTESETDTQDQEF